MSRRLRSRTSSHSSPHGSPTGNGAGRIAPPEPAIEPAEIVVRYAESDDDVISVHQFLCVVAGPTLPGPIDGKDSATEVWRCANHDVVLMAIRDGMLIGTLGLTQPNYWWNTKLGFLVNRFYFCLPGSKAWLPLLREAKAIAVASEKELIIISEARGKVTIYNRSKRRGVYAPGLATPTASPSAPHVL